MLLGLRSLWEGQTPTPPTQDNAFGLARLFYWQREQDELRRKKLRQQEEELLALFLIE